MAVRMTFELLEPSIWQRVSRAVCTQEDLSFLASDKLAPGGRLLPPSNQPSPPFFQLMSTPQYQSPSLLQFGHYEAGDPWLLQDFLPFPHTQTSFPERGDIRLRLPYSAPSTESMARTGVTGYPCFSDMFATLTDQPIIGHDISFPSDFGWETRGPSWAGAELSNPHVRSITDLDLSVPNKRQPT